MTWPAQIVIVAACLWARVKKGVAGWAHTR